MSSYEDRLKEYQDSVYGPEYAKHVVGNLRRDYPEIPDTMSDAAVITAHRKMFGSGLDDQSYYDRIDKAYGQGFEPSKPAPERSLVEKVQNVAPQIPGAALHLGEQLAPFAAAAIPVMGKVPGAGQIGMAVNTAATLAGTNAGSAAIGKTMNDMPPPDLAVLKAKGYSPAQIANVLRGYADVQTSLAADLQDIAAKGREQAATGVANLATVGMGGKEFEKLGEMIGGKTAAAGARTLAGGARAIAGKVVPHVLTGARIGGAYGATQEATQRALDAKAAGLGADDIFKAITEGGWHGLKGGAAIGAILSGALATPGAAVSVAKETKATGSMLRQAHADALAHDAQRINLAKFASQFRPSDVAEKFHEEGIAAQGDDLALANNIVKAVWGEDVAATEDGMKAASKLYEKLIAAGKLQGRMVDLPSAPLPANAEPPQGMVSGQPGVPTPEPNVVGNMQVEPGPPAFVPPQGIPQSPELAAPLSAPPPVTPTLEGIAPPEGLPGPTMSAPLGPVETGGRAPSAAPEIAPRLESVPPTEGIRPEPMPPSKLPGMKHALAQAVARSGTPEEQAAFAAAQRGATRGPGEGYAKRNMPLEPNPVSMPSTGERVASAAKEIQNLGKPTGTPDTRAIGDVEYRVSPAASGDALELNYIRNVGGERGAGQRAMEKITAMADERGLPMVVDASPLMSRGGKMPIEKLTAWYAKHGFEPIEGAPSVAGNVLMRREPALPALAERTKGLAPEQAQIAAGNVTNGKPLANGAVGNRLEDFLNKQAESARKRLLSGGVREAFTGGAQQLADMSIVAAAEMFSRGLRTKTAVTNWLIDKWGEEVRPHAEAIFQRASKRLLQMFKTEGNAKRRLGQLISLRDSGAHGMDWYEETNDYVQKEFGEDADMFLRFLAATSAGSSTEAGANLALKAFGQWKQGLPFDGMRGQHMVMMLDQAARGEEFGGDKIASFYRALKGDKEAVVLDRWMIHALGLPMKKGSLGENDYKLYEQIVRNLAGDAKMSPRQFQAAVWEGARVSEAHARLKSGGIRAVSKIGSARPLEHLIKAEFGELTPYQWVQHNRMRLEDLNAMSDGLRSARAEGGYTFNPGDWTADKTPGYVVTLLNDKVPNKEFYPNALTKFKSQVKKLLTVQAFGDNHLNIGTFKLPDGNWSLDLNVVIPDGPGAREKAIAIGKANRQFEIGEIGPDGNYVTGHPTGYDPKKHGPQFLPPGKGPERAAWFKSAIGRANALLDQLSFKLR